MFYAVSKIKENITVMENQLKTLNEKKGEEFFEETKERVLLRLSDIIYNFLEICANSNINNGLDRNAKPLFLLKIETLKNSKDFISFKNASEDILNFLKSNECYFNDYRNSFAVDIRTTDFVTLDQYIESRKEPFNVLFFDCLRQINEGKICLENYKDQYHTYAIYAKMQPTYASNLDNTACGVGFNSRFSNNVFDIMVSYVEYTTIASFSGIRNNIVQQKELLQLRNTIKYLRTDGLLQFIIPYFRMYHQLAFFIAKNFENVRVFKINDMYCEITGIKTNKKDYFCSDTYHMLLDIYTYFKDKLYISEEIRSISKYKLPNLPLAIETFRGSNIMDTTLENVLAHSDCIEHINDSEYVTVLDHHPLLPFNTGQIGLILASGCLDGVIQEDPQNSHLIKGRVYQKTATRQSEDKMTVHRYNQVQINAVTPDGTFITIS